MARSEQYQFPEHLLGLHPLSVYEVCQGRQKLLLLKSEPGELQPARDLASGETHVCGGPEHVKDTLLESILRIIECPPANIPFLRLASRQGSR